MSHVYAKEAEVTIRMPGGARYDLRGTVTLSQETDTLDVSSAGDMMQHVAGITRVTLEVIGQPFERKKAPPLAEAMARAVLDHDLAAARGLADWLCEEVSRAGDPGFATRDELIARIANLERQLVKAAEATPTNSAMAYNDWMATY